MPPPNSGTEPINNPPEGDPVFSLPQSRFEPPPGQPDSKAQAEAVKFASGGDLEEDGKKQEHSRHQKFRNHLNAATLALFWTIIGALILGLAVYTWHLLLPTSRHFLDAAQLEKLQTILAAALISGSLRGYVDQRMK